MDEVYWTAHYNDGDKLTQSEGVTFSNIERDRLIAFDLWMGSRLVLRVDFNNDDVDEDIGPKRLIFRRRNQKRLDGIDTFFYIVGWQRTVKGRVIQAINYIFPDGQILLGGQFVERDFQHKIVPLPWESDLVE